jgi:Domain of unknown function (DUF5655)
MTLEEYFATGPPRERPIFERVWAHVGDLDDAHVEPVSIGLLFKRGFTFAELRPMKNWVALSFGLSRPEPHPRITRRMAGSTGRTWYVVRLYGPDDVDDQVRDWLTESYLDSG